MASIEEINKVLGTGQLDAFNAEVARDKRVSPTYGREFGALMQRRADAYNQAQIEAGKPEAVMPELRGPWLQWSDVLRQYEQLQGWQEYEGAKAVFGTSNNRADSSEIWKMAGVARALEMSGIEPPKMLYFIDPLSHTTEELFTEMGQDLGLPGQEEGSVDTEIFSRTFGVTPREDIQIPEIEDPAWLPPFYLKAPTPEQVDALPFPETMNHTKQLMREAAEAAEGTHLGNWRIELDRRLIGEYLQKIGMPADMLVVESFEKILGDSKEITVNEIAERAKHAWTTYRPVIVGEGDVAAERMPVIMRMVHKGKRIYIDADFKVFDEDISEGRKYIQDEEMVAFAQSIRETGVHTLMTSHPVNMGGVGYAVLCARLAENAKADNPQYDQEAPLAFFLTDHYTAPKNMGITSSEVMRGKGLDSMWITKGTRGRRILNPKTGETNIDYWTPPDMLVDAERPPSDMGRDIRMVQTLAEIYHASDAHTHVGSYFDAMQQTEIGPKFVPVPAKTIDMIAGQAQLPENELGIQLPPMERKQAWRLVNSLTGLTPGRFNEIVFGRDSATDIHIGSGRELQIAGQALDYLESLGFGEYFTAEARAQLHETVEALAVATAKGEVLYREHRTVLSKADWITYWNNKILAFNQVAAEHGIPLPADFLQPPADDATTMERRASGSAMPFMEAVRNLRKGELLSARPEVLQTMQAALGEVDALRDRYNSLRSLMFSLRPKQLRSGGVVDAEKVAAKERELIQNKVEFGFAPDATEADIQPAIDAVAQELEARANPALDSVITTVGYPVQEQKGKGKAKDDDISEEEKRQIFDRKGNISPHFTARMQHARNVTAYLSKLSVIRNWSGEQVSEQAQVAATSLETIAQGESVLVSPETVKIVDEAHEQIQANVAEQALAEYERLAQKVNALWTASNHASLGDKLAVKRALEDRVHDEVTVIKDTYSPRLAALRGEVLGLYTKWRNSMIAAIAQQGFTLS